MESQASIEILCFGCKKHQNIHLLKEQVKEAKNKRYYATAACPECGRKLTSLIKREVYQNVQGETPSSANSV